MWKPMFIALACTLASTTHAEMYKWVDAEGHVQFSDKKPEKITKSVESLALPKAQIINGRVSTSQNAKAPEENTSSRAEVNAEKHSQNEGSGHSTQNR